VRYGVASADETSEPAGCAEDVQEQGTVVENPAASIDEIPLSEYAQRLEQAISRLNGRVKYCGKNSFLHLRKAWAIKSLDPGMAAFRSITAEEEAATALIYALKSKRYPHAEKLNPRRHDHKASIYALLQVISGVFAKLDYIPQLFLLDKADPPHIRMQIDIHKLAGIYTEEPFFAEPIDPLDFTLSDIRGVKGFSEEFAQFASDSGCARTREYIETAANLRNRILYASDNGIPRVQIPNEFIIDRKNRVLTILTITLMIEQTHRHQSFVNQCLGALLHALERLDQTSLEAPIIR
jgi:hypothetical protein